MRRPVDDRLRNEGHCGLHVGQNRRRSWAVGAGLSAALAVCFGAAMSLFVVEEEVEPRGAPPSAASATLSVSPPRQFAERPEPEREGPSSRPTSPVQPVPVEARREMLAQSAAEPTADPEESLITGNVDVATLALKLEMARAARAPEVAELERQYVDAGRVQAQVLERAGYRPSRDAGEPP